jgi:hypothetical protein
VKNQQLFVAVVKTPGYGFMKYFYYTFCQGYMNYSPAAYVVTFARLYSYDQNSGSRGNRESCSEMVIRPCDVPEPRLSTFLVFAVARAT